MYEHTAPDGHVFQCSQEFIREVKGRFHHYETTYKAVYTDEVIETNEMEVTIDGSSWYGGYGKSYRNLNTVNLANLARIYKNGLYIKKGDEEKHFHAGFFDEGFKEVLEDKGSSLFYKRVIKAEIIAETNHEYYISTKADSWEGNEYNVNFRFYPGEVVPLPFLCSSWVESVIRNGKIGNYRLCGADMSFADMLLYLNKSLEHLREREEKEREMLVGAGGTSWLTGHADWDAILCEWKIKNRIHALTPTRAKRFLKELQVSK